ncbi:FKBP-type peptidyl-prolyl cis-trans isomerase [Cellulomonas carbonis]|uniref:Peptidyl-prolyl cis-trans isomerase n=1 Tax=Cellulomonas carbonis T26 TaxID=947969 RepID=A0A0A0BRA9_9CELL|nr:FKBP-type peptidyl-prolyl cis-trans isomerase [Cellulomonas carbonis]KGM11008.1 peptidylprolyl isomerase [Cellulomonas carbonis T26]GGB95812.1 peptidylprolyl isomerase [Cellulomonas carbonis]
MRRHAAAAVVVALAAVTALVGCSAEQEQQAEVEVTGEAGSVPELVYERPLEVAESRAELVWEGTGPEVVDGEPVLVDYYAEDGTDGTLIGETYSSEPKPYLLSAEALGVDIYEALRGRTVGSRVVHLVPPDAGNQGPTVAVFDLLPTRAEGEPVDPREGVPTVELAPDGEPTITVPATEPPADLVVQPLIRGAGPQVQAGQVIVVQYTGVTWSDGAEFDSSWSEGKLPTVFPIGVDQLVPGWDQGLVEQTVGSQVLLVVPPHLGYGGGDTELADETLVFVVDILAARGGPTEG